MKSWRSSLEEFFASGASRRYNQKLEQIGELFKKAHDYPNEGTVRDLARNQFLVVMNVIIEMNDDPTWHNSHVSDAEQLFGHCVASLGPAVAAGRLDRSSPGLVKTGGSTGTRWRFFWRLVKQAYEKGSLHRTQR